MTELAITTLCPCCEDLIDVPEAGEIECPWCTWEFVCDEEGFVTDDGGLDPDPPFQVGEDGELDADGLWEVRCGHCARRLEVGEPGVHRCPCCGHSVFARDPR